jgi:hypothetical protein
MISGMTTRMDEGALPMRPYQLEDVERVERDWASGVRRPAVVVATGLGKSVESAHLATRWLQGERMAGGSPARAQDRSSAGDRRAAGRQGP